VQPALEWLIRDAFVEYHLGQLKPISTSSTAQSLDFSLSLRQVAHTFFTLPSPLNSQRNAKELKTRHYFLSELFCTRFKLALQRKAVALRNVHLKIGAIVSSTVVQWQHHRDCKGLLQC
jgi:hypothetical protein